MEVACGYGILVADGARFRGALLEERDLLEESPLPASGQAFFEVLPRDREDWKLASALLGERQTLRAEGKSRAYRGAQPDLFDSEG